MSALLQMCSVYADVWAIRKFSVFKAGKWEGIVSKLLYRLCKLVATLFVAGVSGVSACRAAKLTLKQ